MAAKVLSSPPHPHPNPLSYRPLKILHVTHHQQRQQQPWRLSQRSSGSSGTNKKREVVMSSLHESLVSTSSSLVPLLLEPPQQLNASSSSISSSLMFVIAAADGAAGYSLASYYTSLGLFVISVPGLWSLIKRSVKSKVVQKTFVGEEKKAPSQVAGEILSFFTRNNFVVTDVGFARIHNFWHLSWHTSQYGLVCSGKFLERRRKWRKGIKKEKGVSGIVNNSTKKWKTRQKRKRMSGEKQKQSRKKQKKKRRKGKEKERNDGVLMMAF